MKLPHRILWSAVLLLPASALLAELSADEYAVLNAVLNHGLGENCAEIIIEEETSSGSLALNTEKYSYARVAELVAVDMALLKSWDRHNGAFDYLGESFNLNCDYQLITKAARNKLFANAEDDAELGWRNFRRKYPNAAGIIRLAKPFISVEASKPGGAPSVSALAYVEFDCGPGCGSGRFVVLNKGRDSSWETIGGGLVWMATE
ncbi:MAG: hypothetical protein AAF387_22770 [Pseudomonadota bacterium]